MTGGGDEPSRADGGATWTLPTPRDFRLEPTVLSHGTPPAAPFRWDAGRGVLTRVLRDAGGAPRRIEVAEEAVERVEIAHGGRPEEIRTLALRVRTPGWEPDEEEMVEVDEALVFILGLADDLHGFHEICRDEPRLRRLPDVGAGRLLRAPTLWEELARAVCGAEAPPNRAVAAAEGLTGLSESGTAWPSPATVVEAGEDGLREVAGLGERAGPVLELARRIEAGELDLGPAEADLPADEELARLFRSVPGIGPAVAERLLILCGRTGRLPVDEGTVAFVRDLHFGGRTPTEAEVRAHYAPYGEWKGLVYWFEVVVELLWPRLGVSF